MAQKLDDLRLAGLELDPRLEAQDPVPAGPLRDQVQDSVPAGPLREQRTKEQVKKILAKQYRTASVTCVVVGGGGGNAPGTKDLRSGSPFSLGHQLV